MHDPTPQTQRFLTAGPVNVFDNLGDVMLSTIMLDGEDYFSELVPAAVDEESNESTEVSVFSSVRYKKPTNGQIGAQQTHAGR